MARIPKPWWREDRQAWFVTIAGERHNLGPDKKEAERKFHELMARQPEEKPAAAPESITVAEVFDKYLAWCQKNREPRTYDWYHDHIQDFINFKPDAARLPAADLKPYHVIEWADSHGEAWSNAYRRGGIVAIQRPFNWATDLGYIETSPIRKIPKPQPQKREQFVSPDTWEKIKNHYADGDPFRDILEFGWETGCRPQESKRIEARHLDLEHLRVVFPPSEAKGKKFTRIIWMTPRAEEIIKRHLDQYPEGVLFRNEDGREWTNQALSCRFGRLKKHLGEKFALYDLRHGFAQDMLEQGADAVTVSHLMGHRSTRMLEQHYSHMDQAQGHLQRVLERRNGRDKDNQLGS